MASKIHFDDIIEVSINDAKASTSAEPRSVYIRRVKYRLQVEEHQNGVEKRFVVDLTDEGRPDAVFRCSVTKEAFRSLQRDQRIRVDFDRFPELFTDFVGLRKNSLEDYFFSCQMPYSEPRSLVLELTEHKRLRSSSLLSLEMVAVAGDELVQKLASVISKLVPANREKEVLCEENKQLRRKIENLDAEAIADLEGEVKELNLALMDKQREIEELKKYEEEGEEMVKALEELDVENKELKTQIGQMNDLEDELEDLREEHNRLIEEYNSLIKQCKPDEDLIQTLADKLKEVAGREEQLLSDLQYEATEREAAQKELQAGSTKYAAMEKFLASISRRLRQ